MILLFIIGGKVLRKFSVLHLSDLHIKTYHNSYPTVLKKLLDSIEEETQNIKSLILIVTGDIIDKSNYETTSNVAVKFFVDLANKLQGKIIKMYFTPGNHDKHRLPCNLMLKDYFNNKTYDEYDSVFEKTDWKNMFKHSFCDYQELLENISQTTGIPVESDLYYCDILKLNDCIIRINSLNSALTSLDDEDKGSLHIGKFQIEHIEQNYDYIKNKENIFDEDIDITLTIMHHPIFWLHKDEYDNVLNSISSQDSLATDVLLRGHTHDRSLENSYSLYNSFSTLVTGIGSENEKSEHPQRYSIYTFMCDLNMIEIIMRSSSEKGYIPDYSAYVNQTDETRKKIHFPIKVHDYFSENHLQLPLAESDFQPIFPSKNILETITDVSKKLIELKYELDNRLFLFKQDFLKDISEKMDENIKNHIYSLLEDYVMDGGADESINEDDIKFIEEILKSNEEQIVNVTKGFLYSICFTFSKIFFNEQLSNEEMIRIQFRIFNKSKRTHDGFTYHATKGNEVKVEKNITPVRWGHGLIKVSFERNEPMIYSFNDEYITDRISETDWKEYLTYAPNMSPNQYYSRNKITYPIFTFGINSSCKKSTITFEVLSFLSLKPIIDDFLQNIHESFNFSFEKLILSK